MGLKIDELKSFIAVADEGSFSAAARKLGKAQSVVSTHIAGMENELGFKLFERTPAPVMTDVAAELLPSARRVIAETERFESRAQALFRLPHPVLYMGVDMGLEIPLILDLVKNFARDFPDVRLQVENISSSESDWFFKKLDMKMALVFSSRTAVDVDEYVLGHAPVCICFSKKHPLAAVDTLTMDDLKRYRQILVAVRDGDAPIASISDDHWEVDSVIWAMGLAARGIGWTILPRSIVLSQPGVRTQCVLREPPIELPPERLVLRCKHDEVPKAYVDWWWKSLKKAIDKSLRKV